MSECDCRRNECDCCCLKKRDKVLVVSKCHDKKKRYKVRLDEFACQLYKLFPPTRVIRLTPIIGPLDFTPSVSVTYNIVETGGPNPQIGCIVTSINGDHIGNCPVLDNGNGCPTCSSNKALSKKALIPPDPCSDVETVPDFVSCPFIWAESNYNLRIDWTPPVLNHQIILDSAFDPEGQTIALSANLPPDPTNTNLDVKLRTETIPTFIDANSLQIKRSEFLSSDISLSDLEVNFGDGRLVLDTTLLLEEEILTYVLPTFPGFDEIEVKGNLQTNNITPTLVGFSILLGQLGELA